MGKYLPIRRGTAPLPRGPYLFQRNATRAERGRLIPMCFSYLQPRLFVRPQAKERDRDGLVPDFRTGGHFRSPPEREKRTVKRKRFTDNQITFALRQATGSMPVRSQLHRVNSQAALPLPETEFE